MKKTVFLAFFVLVFATQSAFALSVKLTRTADLGGANTVVDVLITNLATQMNTDLEKLGSATDFSTALGNSLAYTYNTGTFAGFQDYDLFAVSTGLNGYFAGGETFGVSAAVAGNVGIKANWLLDFLDIKDTNRFYLNFKFGLVPLLPELKRKIDDTTVSFDSMLIGIGANYSIIESKSVAYNLAKWKGVSLGTGIYYTSEELTITQYVNQEISGGYNLYYRGNIPFKISSYNITVPVEALTAIQLLIFNISAGAGLDFNFGSTELTVNPEDYIRTKNEIPSTSVGANDPIGTVEVNVDNGATSLVRLKLLAGIGILLGPVKIEMPVYYYPTADYGLGLTAGIVW